MPNNVEFATKPQIARRMITRAIATALYTRVATKTISEVMSPLEHVALKLKE